MNYGIEIISQLPALIKVLTVFGLVLVILEIKAPLWAAVLIGAVMLGLWFRMGPGSVFQSVGQGAAKPQALFLYAIIFLILVLSRIMDAKGQLKRIVETFNALVGRGSVMLISLPALIGLLPMPGGAIFSAPMVDAAAESFNFSPERKTVTNYWFRHIWEYWWPLYPGVILAISLSGVSVGTWIVFQFPLTFFAVGVGYFFILFRAPRAGAPDKRTGEPPFNGARKGNLTAFIREASPVIVVVALMLIGSLGAGLLKMDKETAQSATVLGALVIGMAWTIIINKAGLVDIRKAVFNFQILNIVLLAGVIMGFKQVLEQSGAIRLMLQDLNRYGIPAIAVLMVLPFVSGLVNGIAIGFVGASYPLIITLLAAQGIKSPVQLMPYMVLAHSFGYMGMILSPVHLCLVLTKDYYKARLLGILRMLLAPCAVMLAVGLGFHFLYLALT